MRTPLLAVATACVVVALASWPAEVRADKVDDLMLKLRSDPDYKIRLSAALNLGKLSDKRAIPALVDGLGDPDRSVRAVATGALGKLVDASVDPELRARVVAALEALVARDPEDSVRAQAQRALDGVRGPLPSGIYVEVGNLGDRTQRGGAILPIMRQTLIASLQKKPGLQVHLPGGRALTEADLRRAGTTAFFVDASLTRLDATGAHVACAVSLILATYPGKSMFGFANGSAEVDVGSTSQRAMTEALGDCVTAVVDDLVATKILPTIQARVP